jgi:hypothetical protein
MNVKEQTNLEKGLTELKTMAKDYKKYGVDNYVNVMFGNLLKSKQNDLDVAKTDSEKANLNTQIMMIQKAIAEVKTY